MRKKRAKVDKKKSRKAVKTIPSIIKNAIFVFVIGCLLLTCIYLIVMKINKKQPQVFGYKFYVVLTGSMKPEISPGDMVIVKNVDIDTIKIGDVITFSDKAGKNITTHRVKQIENTEDKGFLITTKGDANNTEDINKVDESQLLGRVSKTIHGFGEVIECIKKNIFVFAFVIGFIIAMIFIASYILKKMDKECAHSKGSTSSKGIK